MMILSEAITRIRAIQDPSDSDSLRPTRRDREARSGLPEGVQNESESAGAESKEEQVIAPYAREDKRDPECRQESARA